MRERRIAVIIGVGIAAVLVDRFVVSVPPPPGWLLAWAGWILSGLGLFYGSQILQEFVHTLRAMTNAGPEARKG